jgi:hypothetical protein
VKVFKEKPALNRQLLLELTDDEVYEAEYQSDVNLVYLYENELRKISQGVHPSKLLNKRTRRRLFLAGITVIVGHGKWGLSGECQRRLELLQTIR